MRENTTPHVNEIEDDRAYVWNIKCEVMLGLTEHKDTVTNVHVSYDGTYLATGDMAGELFVHKLQESESGPQLTLLKVWEYSIGDNKILPGEGVRCGVADLTGDGRSFCVGYTNGAVKLWDLKSCTVVMEVLQPPWL